jgi:hypothetical protein
MDRRSSASRRFYEPCKKLSRAIFCAGWLGILCSYALTAQNKHQAGVMLQALEYDSCHYDCQPFDRPEYFFCIQVGNEVLIARRKADWVWMYDTSKLLSFSGKEVSLRWDDQSIWLVRTDSKEIRLHRDYSEDLFDRNECTAEIHKHWLHNFDSVRRPDSVPGEAVLIPRVGGTFFGGLDKLHFWIRCSYDEGANLDVCETWDPKGKKSREIRYLDSAGQPVLAGDLIVDPMTTRIESEIHLKNGRVLKEVFQKLQ